MSVLPKQRASLKVTDICLFALDSLLRCAPDLEFCPVVCASMRQEQTLCLRLTSRS